MKAGVKTIDWDERKSRGGDGYVSCGLWLVLRLVHISPLTHILAPPPTATLCLRLH